MCFGEVCEDQRCLWTSDAPNSLTEVLFTVIAEFRMVSFFICILVCLVILNGPV